MGLRLALILAVAAAVSGFGCSPLRSAPVSETDGSARPDAGTDNSPRDLSGSLADAGPGDVGLSDAPADVAAPVDGVAPDCASGNRRCDGLVPQVCSSTGGWQNAPEGTCPVACIAGACVVCRPGSRQCGANQTPQQCSDSGLWMNDGAPCASLCTEGACTGDCVPDTVQCTSSTHQQRCGANGKWGASVACDFACVNNACGGACKPNSVQCTPSGLEQRCTTRGEWGAGTACPNNGACVNGACADCMPGTSRCLSNTTHQSCSGQGFWNTAQTCPFACVGSACGGECRPGTIRCAAGSKTAYVTCDSATGTWGTTATPCPAAAPACGSNACMGVCRPGARRCMTSTRSQLCNDNGQWDTTTDCPHACVGNGSCGTIVFTSSVKYAGFLGPPASLAGADQKCQTLADNAMLPGTYRAWLSSSEPMSNPFIRLERPAGPYVLVDGTVVAQNWADLTDGSLQHAIDMTEQRGTPPETPGSCTRGVWTGTGTNGENAILGDGSQAPTCSNWNYPYPQIRGHVGAWDRTDKAWTDDSCALVTCNVSYPLYCIQN